MSNERRVCDLSKLNRFYEDFSLILQSEGPFRPVAASRLNPGKPCRLSRGTRQPSPPDAKIRTYERAEVHPFFVIPFGTC